DRVTVIYTLRGISDNVAADAAYIQKKYGIRPDQYPDYAALRGDSSDNLPGVPGVGEKTATKLVSEYGDLDGIYEHLEDQTPRLRESLEAAREQVFLNRRLTYLVDSVPLDDDIESFRLEEWDAAQVREVFNGLAFKTLWQRLQEIGGAGAPQADEAIDVEVATVRDPRRLAELAAGPLVMEPVWDHEALIGVMIAGDEGEASFVPAEHFGPLEAAFADPAVPKILHDAKPLVRALFEMDLDFDGLEFDTSLAGYVINPAERAPDLAELAGTVLGLEIGPSADQKAGGAQGTLDFGGAGPDLEGAARRATAVARLVEPLTEQLEARGGATVLRELELPLVRVLARMEEAGIGVDRQYLVELGESLRDRLAGLEARIYQAAGEPFNINSSLQLREILYDKLALPVLKKTPKGAPSTDASVLQKLASEHPVVDHLLEYRALEKLRSTYVDGLIPLIGRDGRIHCVFNQTGAATGRLSSERPNMQNIPIRTEEGRTIRRAFVADEGHRFLVADYSQIELRILAHLSGDPGLLEAFRTGGDIHSATAARVFGADPEAVDPDLRRRAKTINFGLLYGMEAYGLAQRLEISTEEAQAHMDAYFAQFPQVQAFMEGIVERARHDGYTTTLMGRRRYLPELASGNYRIRQAGERMALNAPIQGAAADIIKQAMIELDVRLTGEWMATAMLLQVHDELVFEVPEGEMERAEALVREVMEGVSVLEVPLLVDIATGRTLGDAKG
ncbi:MAG: DNA polymerase I, partial [Actinobacteria bacterium]|nr:DNA polymerase I [Actinomycetota bacterium]